MARLALALNLLMLWLFAMPFAPGVAAPTAPATSALIAAMRGHMAVLASDAFAGREPGTAGEAKTLKYIATQFFDIGLVSGTNDPAHPWFAPVKVVARTPAASIAQFRHSGRLLTLPSDDVLVLTSARRALVEAAPLFFVGRGPFGPQARPLPSRVELAGRIAVLLDREGAGVAAPADPAGQSARQNALLAQGAAAVLTVLDGGRTLASVAARRQRPGYALASDATGGDLEGFVSAGGFDRLLSVAGQQLASLEHAADAADFTPHLIDLAASLEATTHETVIHTHNLIAKLPARSPAQPPGAVLVMAHWDHFGTCAAPPAPHTICNGAIDNASGIAGLIEVARLVARGAPQGEGGMRDVYFLATTSEELGLLGADAFAESPPLPLDRIVAALNLDSIAIAPAGTPMGVVGQGLTPLDAGIAAVAKATHLRLASGPIADDLLRRQDGWALLRHDVPAVMVTSAYGDMARLKRFFDTDYHRPGDVMKPEIELGGAAQDVVFNAALVRYFADPRRYPARVVQPSGRR